MKTNTKMSNEMVLIEAKKMIGRIDLFSIIYDFNDEFMKDVANLKELLNKYENGIIKDSSEVKNLFSSFTKKYQEYINKLNSEYNA